MQMHHQEHNRQRMLSEVSQEMAHLTQSPKTSERVLFIVALELVVWAMASGGERRLYRRLLDPCRPESTLTL